MSVSKPTLGDGKNIEEEKRDDVLILHFKGKLDAITSPDAEKKIFECINSGQHKLIFDFSGVDYLSSAGLRMLLSTAKRLKAFSGKVVLTSLSSNVKDVLVISGFDHLFEVAKTVDEAFKLIKAQES